MKELLMDEQSKAALVDDLAQGFNATLHGMINDANQLEDVDALVARCSIFIAEKVFNTVMEARMNGYAAGYADAIQSEEVARH